MWKIFFTYKDKSKCTLTGKTSDISLELATKYQKAYGLHAEMSVYQRYPKKDYGPMSLYEKIEELKEEAE